MNRLRVGRKIFVGIFATVFLMYTTNVVVLAQEEEDKYVKNIRPERQGRINIFIEYDLEGDPEEMFNVTFTIKSRADSSYSYTPINVIGDLGANVRPGKNRRISWRTSDEYPPVLGTQDVIFVVKAEPPVTESGNTELFIAGGAAVVGVALAIILLSSNKADATQTNNTFPQPPGRP